MLKSDECELGDVVELLIAASEALIINESVESDSTPCYLPPVAVVEMTLRVKQARLDVSEDLTLGTPSCNDGVSSSETQDGISTMDACEDLGVSLDDHNNLDVCDLDISHVEETPICKNCVNHENSSEYLQENIDHLCPRSLTDDALAQGGLVNCSSLEVTEENPQNQDNIDTDIASGLYMPIYVDKIRQASASNTLYVSTEDKKSGSSEARQTLYQPQPDMNLPSQHLEQNIRECTSRFQQGWFGGLTEKEVDAAAPLKQQTGRIVTKPFIGEMSFLSESADAAPDENSVIQERQYRGTEIASRSSIPPGLLCGKSDQGISFSQEVDRPLSPASLDPLCSIVPCSLSIENPGPPKMQSRDDKYIDAEDYNSPTSGAQLVKPSEISNPDSKVQVNQQKANLSTVDEECSEVVVRRRLSSLKSYSMLLCSGMDGLENWQLNSCLVSPLEHTTRLASSDIEMDANESSGTSSAGLCPLNSVPKLSVVQYNEENHESDAADPR
ncbi:hypothetical protein SAY87_029298 [Trapa incisa]|uniref:Uncharacterized protein n=1 Tax=Trapa incisa TaxID=236973 RepID=A0AAN7KAP5_9MYRT|nr:hypothetical protein SAY87_029298 [Trapa incisa]